MIKLNMWLMFILVVGLAACNKDGIILDDDAPHQPERPVLPAPDEPVGTIFAGPSYFYRDATRFTFVGRPVFLTPLSSGDRYEWSVDGVPVSCDAPTYRFIPERAGEYIVSVMIDGDVTGSVKVVCEPYSESECFRPGAPTQATVYEYVPAPGQFINETTANMSPDEAAVWAARRLEKGEYVSLGGFGGYIIVGFGHSIGDFMIAGNAFTNETGASNEPGIVYVMQDVNRNGLPDDEWYELRGSETGAEATVQDYAVTYFRPDSPGAAVKWVDCFGVGGEIDYLAAFHKQESYYPSWITAGSYTLRGTRLPDNSGRNESGQWFTMPFVGGYADNTGSNGNVFHISDAMFPDLTPISLEYVDFIKIQTGVCGKCGILGEISTEVLCVNEL